MFDIACQHIDLSGNASLLDVGCGNMRFERYLLGRIGNAVGDAASLKVRAIDNCEGLISSASCTHGQGNKGPSVDLSIVDINALYIEAAVKGGEALAGQEFAKLFGKSDHDIAVAFGLMHHIPLENERQSLIDAMVGSLRKGGICAISFWQFSKDRRILDKAKACTRMGNEKLGLGLSAENGDFLLNWQNDNSCFRYCHDFSDAEISGIIEGISHKAKTLEIYSADGRNNALNKYAVLQKTG